MATSTQRGRTWYSVGAALLVLTASGAAAIYATSTPADATADLTLGSLDVSGVNRTVNASVTDVMVTATLDWRYDVPDAERRFVKLKAGPNASALETITWTYSDVSTGQDAGTTTLKGSLLDAAGLSASDFDPGMGNTTSKEVVIAAVFEVERTGGDVVTARVEQPVTITLTDEETLKVSVGGTADVTVLTETA